MNDSLKIKDVSIIETNISHKIGWMRRMSRRLHHRWYRWYIERRSKLAFIGRSLSVLIPVGLALSSLMFQCTPHTTPMILGVLAFPIFLGSVLLSTISVVLMVQMINYRIRGESIFYTFFEQSSKAETVLKMRVRGHDVIIGFNHDSYNLNLWYSDQLDLCPFFDQAFEITGSRNHIFGGAVISVITPDHDLKISVEDQDEIISVVNKTITRELERPGSTPRASIKKVNYQISQLNDLLNRVIDKSVLMGVDLDTGMTNRMRILLKKSGDEANDSSAIRGELSHMVTVLNDLNDKLESYSQDARKIRESTSVFEDLSRKIPVPSV